MSANVPDVIGHAIDVPFIGAYDALGCVESTCSPLLMIVGNIRPSSCGPQLEKFVISPAVFTAPA